MSVEALSFVDLDRAAKRSYNLCERHLKVLRHVRIHCAAAT